MISSMPKGMACDSDSVSDESSKVRTWCENEGSMFNIVGSNPDWSSDRRDTIKWIMKEKKKRDRYPLSKDIYAFFFVAPVFSVEYFFSLYVVALKYTVFAILATDIRFDAIHDENKGATAAKFFLIPVAIAMQDDLINSYFFFGNAIYCNSALAFSKHATKKKLAFSFLLRTVDGFFSLAVNFGVMVTTDTTLGVFLNFAALSFLQSIDDVFYELVMLGFFGDRMEHMASVCAEITFRRRSGNDNNKICGLLRISHLDTILFLVTLLICLVIYIYMTLRIYGYFDEDPPDVTKSTNKTILLY